MLKNRKRWLFVFLAVALVAGLLSVPQIVAANSGYSPQPQEVPNIPQELRNLPRVMELKPDPACEVKLDRVVIINFPNGVGQEVQVSETFPPGKKPIAYSLEIDAVRGTYKTLKDVITEETPAVTGVTTLAEPPRIQ
ncbi:MAG: hypothetical protein AB1510_08855 [Bacillota bacterium]